MTCFHWYCFNLNRMGAGTGIFNGAGMGILLGGNPIVFFNSAGLGIL